MIMLKFLFFITSKHVYEISAKLDDREVHSNLNINFQPGSNLRKMWIYLEIKAKINLNIITLKNIYIMLNKLNPNQMSKSQISVLNKFNATISIAKPV